MKIASFRQRIHRKKEKYTVDDVNIVDNFLLCGLFETDYVEFPRFLHRRVVKCCRIM